MPPNLSAVSLVALALALPVAAQPPDDWRPYVEIKDSQFDRVITLTGRRVGEGQFYGGPARTTHLASTVHKATGEVTHALVFTDAYEGRGWRFWSSAATNRARGLKVTAVSRKVGTCGRYTGCSHYEVIFATLPSEVLTEALSQDVQVRFVGSGATHIVTIDRLDAMRQLAAAQAAREQVAPSAAGPAQ